MSGLFIYYAKNGGQHSPPPPPLEIRLWSRFMFPPKQLHFIVLCAKTLAQHSTTTKGNQLLR